MKRDLQSVTDEWLRAASVDRSPKTIEAYRKMSRRLITVVGNIQVQNLEPRHVDTFFADCRARGNGPDQLNQHLSCLRMLCLFARQRRLAPQTWDPTVGRTRQKVIPTSKLLLPATEFPRLLDAADHPRDRMVIALGIFLFLRSSEISGLRVRDVDLDREEIEVTIQKTKQRDLMPICAELNDEIRRWLTWYSQSAGGLQPDWWLVPTKARPQVAWDPVAHAYHTARGEVARLAPARQFDKVAECVQRSLKRCGYETYWQGGHTLRRSGARALYDRLSDDGHDSAIRRVQAMLHHSSMKMTEHYIGIELDTKKRNSLLKGQAMFPRDTSNVTPLRVAGG